MFSSPNSFCGFLPSFSALTVLPAAFAPLEKIVSQLPLHLSGTLNSGENFAALIAALPELSLPTLPLPPADTVLDAAALQSALRGGKADAHNEEQASLLHALFRDYSITASAFMLEPKSRGLTVRARLPPQLAKPLWALAHALGLPPFLEYTSYCLGNITSRDGAPSNSRSWYDQRLIRMLKGGPEESTFVIVHSEIESHTGDLLNTYADVLAALDDASASALTTSLISLHTVVARILSSQLKMFNACDPSGYVKLVRPWIFGTRGNSDFPNGNVTFEGVSDPLHSSKWTLDSSAEGDTNPWVSASLRGETGAQSTIIPSLDALLGVTHSFDALRIMLAELEHYRPPAHRQLLRSLRARMWGNSHGSPADAKVAAGVEERGLSAPPPPTITTTSTATDDTTKAVSSPTEVTSKKTTHALKDTLRSLGDRDAIRAFNAVVEQIHAFREIHIVFADLYITRFTDRTNATGGTPYKAYLAKHTRESSVVAQISDGPGGIADIVQMLECPAADVIAAQLTAVLDPLTPDGIPPYLRERHAVEIAKAGGENTPALAGKAFPTKAPW